MAGRTLGLLSIVGALAKLSPAEIKRLISTAPHLDRVQRLEREREGHLEAIKKLDRQIAKLSGGNGSVAAPVAKPGRKRRRWKLSAATHRKMSEAAKRRYSKPKGSAPEAESKPKAARRAFSAETRQKMAEAQRRRWAKVKAATSSKGNAQV